MSNWWEAYPVVSADDPGMQAVLAPPEPKAAKPKATEAAKPAEPQAAEGGNWWEKYPAVREDVGADAVLSGIEDDRKREEDQALLHEAHQSIETYGEIPTVASQIVTDTASVVERLIGMDERADEVNRKSAILDQAMRERDAARWRSEEDPAAIDAQLQDNLRREQEILSNQEYDATQKSELVSKLLAEREMLEHEQMSTLERAGQYVPFLKQGVRGAARSLGSAVLGAKGAGVYGAIGLASAQEANQAITEGTDAGLEGSALAGYAASQGVIEAVPAMVMQRLGLGGVEAMIAGPSIRGGIKAGVLEAIKRTGQEIPEELATEIGHAVETEYSGVDRQALDPDRLSSMVADTVLQTVLMGAGAGAIQTVKGEAQARLERLQAMRAKGFVSAEDAKKEGIEGKNRKERLANADAAIEQLTQEAAAQTPPPLPATPPPLPKRKGSKDAGQVQPTPQVQEQGNSQVPVQGQGAPQQSAQEPAAEQVLAGPAPKQVEGELVGDNNQLRIFKDGKWRNATVTSVNEDEAGWRVKHIKITDPATGSYEYIPFPDDAGKGYGSPEQAREEVFSALQKKYGQPPAGLQKPTEPPPAGLPAPAKPPEQPAWDVIKGADGKLYRENPQAKSPSERIQTRQPVDPAEGVVLVTKDQFGKPVPPETLKARQEFADKAKPGAAFEHKGYQGQSFKVLDDGTLLNSSGRRMGDVQTMANTVEPGGITWKAGPAAGSSEGVGTKPATGSPLVSPDAPAKPETSMGEAAGEDRSSEARAGETDGLTEGFRSLPAKGQAAFETEWTKGGTSIKNILYPDNKNYRAEFEARTGIKLPKTVGGTFQAVEDWHNAGRPLKSNAPAPDADIEKAVVSFKSTWGVEATATPADKLSPEQQEALDFATSRGQKMAFVDIAKSADKKLPIGTYYRDSKVSLISNELKGDALWGMVGHEMAHSTGLDTILPADSAELKASMDEYYQLANPEVRKRLKTDRKRHEREGRALMVQRFFEDKTFRDSLKTSNPSMWDKLREAVLKFMGQWTPKDEAKRLVLEELRTAQKPEKRTGKKPLETLSEDKNSSAQPDKSSEVDSKPGTQPEGVESAAPETGGAGISIDEFANIFANPEQPSKPEAKKPASKPSGKKAGKKTGKKPSPKEGVQEGLKEAKEGADLILKGLKDLGTNLFSGPPINADIARGMGMMANGLIKAGKYKFVDFIDEAVKMIGAPAVRYLGPYLEAGWNKKAETDSRLDKATSVADYLSDEPKALYTVEGEEGMIARVFNHDSGGFSVSVTDTDSGLSGDQIRIFPKLEQAKEYADTIKVGESLTEVSDATTDARTGTADQAAGQPDRRDGQDAASAADAVVLEGAPAKDDGQADGTGDTGGVRNRPGGKVRRGAGKADSGGVDGSGRRGADGGRASADDLGGRGTGRDRAPQATRPNYHLTNPDAIIGGGPKAKFERNRKAIEIVRDIEETGRAPTAEELDTLAGYTGWGAFGQELFKGSWENPQPSKGWEEQNEWLRIYLGEQDWKSAQQSIVNAHYTDPQTVTAMWDMLRRMGFDGGRVLEPSMGIGNFFSLMPRDLMDKSSLTGIELDTMTAKIAKLLHPQANIQQKGYEESQTPDNFYDVILSNVPFGNYPIADRRYKQDFSIHNYFFKRAFDQVKPGGVVAFLTSNMTMDGKTQAKLMRAQIAEQGGDLVTAIRLPSGAFQAYAGTKVVADLIVIRKRKPGEEPMPGQDWINVVEIDTPAGEKITVNEYWVKNPKNILGTMTWGHGTTSGRPGMIVQQPDNLQKLLDKAVKSVPEGIVNTERTATQGRERANTTAMRQNSVLSQDDELWIVKGEQLVPLIEFTGWYTKGTTRKGVFYPAKPETIAKSRREIESLLDVREAMRTVLDKQAASEDASESRAELNRVYDAFVAKYGPIGPSAAAKHLRKAGDPMANTLLALEEKKGGKYIKRPIFERPTVRQRKKVDNPTVNDAFAMERNRSLDLDMEKIAEAAKVPVEEAIRQLESEGKIYKTGTGTYDAADVFLSGNMARKLRQLEAAQAEGIDGLERSIEAVRERIPKPVPYSQIEAKLGATWVQGSDYADFLGHLLNEPATAFTVEMRVNGWKASIPTDINNKTEAQHTHGHPGIAFSKLFNAAMNNADVKLTMPDPQNPDSKITDPVATAAANAKIGELREKFANWIWTNPDRITRLSAVYNEELNSTVTPEFDDVPLQFEGMALQRGDQPFNLRHHQESAVWRAIVSGKGIFAHEVGTGKTYTIAALAMELRRLGLASKPMVLAHNANSMAVRNEVQEAYPNANILYVDNLDAKNKDATLQAIATEDWDLIVVPHSMAERFQLRPETVRALLKPEMDALEAAALEAFEESEASDYAKGDMPADLDAMDEEDLRRLKEPTAKELVKERLKLRAKIEEAVQAMEKGTGIFFEDMGVDAVMVDEAHLFKKLPITTKQKIKGLNKSASQKGTMMMMLADYIRSINNGRGVYMFTGTPITNTINEIYNMMRFVMAEEMQAAGVRSWDGWFNTFATQETLTELSSGGTWENFDRLSSFVNLPELRQMVGQYMDIVFADEMPEFRPREHREGRSENPVGRPYKQVHNVTLEMLPAQERHSEQLKQRYTTFKNATGKDKVRMMREPGGQFNPLVIEGEGVKLAMDPRLVRFGIKPGENGQLTTDTDQLDPKDPKLKINRMLHNAMAHYHEHPKSAQMIFMQIGHDDWTTRTVGRTPAGKPITERVRVFNLAKEIKRRLMEEGVPEEEIALFSTMTKEKRTETAQLMKEGKVRFAIGSTETMGTGVNAQDELIAMHHLDAPWMPGDLEQRNGRGHRQGNKWNTVHEYRYLTEGPQDGRRWQVLLTKSRFIEKFMKADGSERTIEMDDIDMSDDGAGNDMEKTFAAAAGDPRIMMKIRLEDQVAKLERARHNHARTITETVSRANQKLEGIERQKSEIAKMRSDHQTWMDNRPSEGDKPALTLRDKTYSGLNQIDDALDELEERYRNTIGAEVQIGEYRGLPLFMNNGMLFVGESKQRVSWVLSSLQGVMANTPERIAKIEKLIEKDERFIEMAHKAVGEPFPKQKQLDAKRAKLEALEAEMAANPDVAPAWLRAGAPVGTAVYHKGTEYEVAGHRKDHDVLFVLYADGDKFIALPAKELTDKDGTPLFPDLQDAVQEEQAAEDDQDDGTITPSTKQQSQKSNVRQSRSTSAVPVPGELSIAAADIQKTVERLFDVAVRQEGFSERAEGIYKWLTRSAKSRPSPEVVRTKEKQYASLAVLSHEVAHHIDEKLKVVKGMPAPVKSEVKTLDYEPEKARAFEGWAEFFRRYVTEPPVDVNGTMMPNTIVDAPQATEWFEQTFLPAHPELAESVGKFREYAQQWANQSVFARIGSMIADRKPHDLEFKERWKRKGKRFVNRLKSYFLDKFHTLNWIQEEAKAKGYKGIGIYDLTMAYFLSASSHATIAFEEGVRSLMTGEQIGKTKLWAMSRHLESDGEYDEAIRYALARHTLFMDEVKPGYNTGVDVDDAQAWVEEAESQGKADRYEHFARELAQFNDDLIMMLVDAGALSQEDAGKILNYYRDDAGVPYYFPLHRISDLEENEFSGTSAGFVNLGKPVKGRSRKGSGRQIVDPVDATITRAIKFYGRAIQARQAHTLARTLDPKLGGVGGMGGLMDRVPAKRVVHQGTIEEILRTLVSSGAIEEDQARAMRIAARIRDPENGLPSEKDLDWFAEKHNVDDWVNHWEDMEAAAEEEPDALAVISLWRPDYTPSAQKRTVMIYDPAGNKLMYEMDNDLYRVATGMQEVQFNGFMNILRESARYFKTGSVGLSTGFGTANLLRDYWEFQGKANHVKGLKTLGKPWQMLGMYVAEKTKQSMVGKSVGKKLGITQKPSNALIRLYEESGGKVYSVVGHDADGRSIYRRRKMGKSTMSRLGLSLQRPMDTADNMLNNLQELIAMSDAPPRLADAEAALAEHGFVARGDKWLDTRSGQVVDHLPESARIAAAVAMAEATINFKRIGAAGQYVEAFFPFFNATVQATYRQYQQMKNLKSLGQDTPEGERALRMLVYLSALAATGVFYWLLRHDDDDYRNQDAWLRDGYWTWGENGKTYLRIPKPRDFAVVSNVAENMLDAWAHDDARETADILKREVGGRIPTGGGMLRGAVETYVADYDYFRGRELEDESVEKLPKPYRTNSYTSRMSDALGKQFGKATNTSPIQFQHLLNSATGGMYGRLTDTYDAVLDGRVGPEHIPFVRGLMIDRRQTRPIGEFYQQKADLEELAATQKIEQENVDPQVAAKLAHFDWVSEVMTAIRKDEAKIGKKRSFENEKYITGLARAALGYEEQESNPNPLTAKDLPEDIRETVEQYRQLAVAGAAERLSPRSVYKSDEAYADRKSQIERAEAKFRTLNLSLDEAKQSLIAYWEKQHGPVREKGDMKDAVRTRLRKLEQLFKAE